jgi:hypothetical protein
LKKEFDELIKIIEGKKGNLLVKEIAADDDGTNAKPKLNNYLVLDNVKIFYSGELVTALATGFHKLEYNDNDYRSFAWIKIDDSKTNEIEKFIVYGKKLRFKFYQDDLKSAQNKQINWLSVLHVVFSVDPLANLLMLNYFIGEFNPMDAYAWISMGLSFVSEIFVGDVAGGVNWGVGSFDKNYDQRNAGIILFSVGNGIAYLINFAFGIYKAVISTDFEPIHSLKKYKDYFRFSVGFSGQKKFNIGFYLNF